MFVESFMMLKAKAQSMTAKPNEMSMSAKKNIA